MGISSWWQSRQNGNSTNFDDIEFGFFPHVAPKTVKHIFKLVRLGCYNTNNFFRVDKGFVAQVADVVGGRLAPLNAEQHMEGEKTIVGKFSKVKHVRGILSTGRSLVWRDGFYNGVIRTRKTVQPMELSADELSNQRSVQLRDLFESLSAEQPARRPCAALSPEDLSETEWLYPMCMSFSFAAPLGLHYRSIYYGSACITEASGFFFSCCSRDLHSHSWISSEALSSTSAHVHVRNFKK